MELHAQDTVGVSLQGLNDFFLFDVEDVDFLVAGAGGDLELIVQLADGGDPIVVDGILPELELPVEGLFQHGDLGLAIELYDESRKAVLSMKYIFLLPQSNWCNCCIVSPMFAS